jgi:DNA-binding FadR family transcriptional regulator
MRQSVPQPQSDVAPRAWALVLGRIEDDLVSGAVRHGDHLPAERALAADLGVGRSSVREALRALEVLGLVHTQTGSGPGAGATIVARPSDGMTALMRLQVAGGGLAVHDVVRTRLVLEAAVVTDLASCRPAADLSAALTLLDDMELGPLSPAAFLALDTRFHLALAEAAGNAVIAAIMAGLRDAVERYILAGASTLRSWSATSARLIDEHRGIIAAIEGRDPALAVRRIEDHINRYYVDMGRR